MNEQIGNKINDKTYIKLTPFKGFVLENFPFIEADFDAITNYQLLCKVIEYLNNVISNQNTVQELGTDLVNAYNSLVDAVNLAINEFETDVTADINQFKVDINDDFDEFTTNITTQFNNLQNYVNNYFDNNFPELVNDKLDEMAEDGTLENLLDNYAHLTKSYNTYTEMMADSSTFTNGLRLKTLGYYTINDGGGAEYYVSNTINNNVYQEELSNNLYLNLVVKNNTINIKQLGAKETDSTLVKHDIEEYIETYINLLDSYNDLKLYIPSGAYYCSQLDISREKGFYIYGDEGFITDNITGTVISSYEDNQNYIFNIGSNSNYTYNWILKNICFTSCDYKYDNGLKLDKNNVKSISYAINLLYAVTGITDNLFFSVINGGAIQLSSCWENYFKLINCRYIYNIDSNIINFKTVDPTLTVNANITANSFDSIYLESIFASRVINFELNSGAVNNTFGVINFEESWVNINNLSVTRTPVDIATWNDYASDVEHMALFGGFTCSATINSINCDVIGVNYLLYDDKKYIYDTIFTHDINLGGMNISTSNIEIDNCTNTIKLYRLKNTKTTNLYTRNIINNILNKGSNKVMYDVDGFSYLQCNSPLNRFGANEQDVLKLQNDITPAYKVMNVYGGGDYCLLYSNQNATNDLKLCVKPFPSNSSINSMTFLKKGTELNIHALIPLNEVVKVILHSGGVNEPYDLTGTGSFKTYNLEFTTSLINSGHDDIGIKLSGSSVSKNILIDYIY